MDDKIERLLGEFETALEEGNVERAASVGRELGRHYEETESDQQILLKRLVRSQIDAPSTTDEYVRIRDAIRTFVTTNLIRSSLLLQADALDTKSAEEVTEDAIESVTTLKSAERELRQRIDDVRPLVDVVELPPNIDLVSFRVSEDTVPIGERVPVTVIVGNVGDTHARATAINVQTETGLDVDPSSLNIGTVEARDHITAELEVIARAKGIQTITVDVTSENAGSVAETAHINAIDPDEESDEDETRLENHVTLFSYSSEHSASYRFAVSGEVKHSARAGDAPYDHRFVTTGDDEDVIDGGRVEGGIAGGGDAYRFSGELESFAIDRGGDHVFAYLNGTPLDDWTAANRPRHLVLTGGDSDDHAVSYAFEVTGTVGQSERALDAPVDGDLVTVDPEDVINGQTVDGGLAGGIDAYYYSGELAMFQIEDCDHDSVRAWLDGTEVDPCSLPD